MRIEMRNSYKSRINHPFLPHCAAMINTRRHTGQSLQYLATRTHTSINEHNKTPVVRESDHHHITNTCTHISKILFTTHNVTPHDCEEAHEMFCLYVFVSCSMTRSCACPKLAPALPAAVEPVNIKHSIIYHGFNKFIIFI